MSGASGIEHDPAAALNKPPREHSRWMAMRARAARVPLAVAAAAPLVGGVLLVIQAWLLARVLDQAIVQGAPRAELATPIVAIAALMLARAALAWLGERAGAAAAERIKRQVREALFARLLALGPQWSRQRASGELASAMVEQVEALDAYFAKYLPAMGAAAVLPVAFAVVVLPVDVIAGLLLLATAPLIPLFMALVGWGAEAASRRHLQAFARLSGFFADRLRGLATLKLYGRAEAEAQSVVAASDALRQRTMAVLRIAFLSSAVLEFFAALGVAGVAVYIGLTYLGFLDVRASVLTLQGGFFCLLLAPEVYGPLRQFAAHYHDRAAARAAVAQIARTFDGLPTPEAAAAPPAHAAAGRGAARLAASGLTVTQPGRPAPVLREAALQLDAGAHVALRGASGAGKTTLLELLARLRDGAGAIALDGMPLADWDEAALRERVVLIGQRPYLYAGSIGDNIRLARPGASAAQVEEAARRACVMEFAQALPRGLDTPLGSRGHGLSGGQAQRVALARLFLRDPGLILLDEPAAHLDAATQARVLDEILDFARGRTLLLATHADAVARRLPRQWALEQGRLRELQPA
ncbi:thiol reductant ABC exporter subunit CydD [Bordetella bronchiseptica]|uniref:thiol reductant ABC exporter subunit CydD n=1 Tax=Bordetella bronchiseptica TaxID=518 RepID=UPI00081D0CB2|nr:thiol reductant ABC exporter subunit CydD [Bordetella bronchiseptica]AOB28596.1 thiol reductant ABC exporter subunit CydD [Bordetella bronchiseptica]AZW45944.1 thiol reductant ABC exporter subunit CydD [Bordetella bronchiseptica]